MMMINIITFVMMVINIAFVIMGITIAIVMTTFPNDKWSINNRHFNMDEKMFSPEKKVFFDIFDNNATL